MAKATENKEIKKDAAYYNEPVSVKLFKESWPLSQLCKQRREEETHEISLLQLPFVHRTVM